MRVVWLALALIGTDVEAQRADDLACPAGAVEASETVAGTTRRWCAKGGTREGTYVEDGPRGHVEGSYRADKMDGAWRADIGKRRVDAELRGNQLDGWCRLRDSGQLVEELQLKATLAHGVWRMHRGGALVAEQTMAAGRAHGLLRVLDRDGRLREIAVFVNGVEVPHSRVYLDRDGRVVSAWPEERAQEMWQAPPRPPADAREALRGPACATLAILAFPRAYELLNGRR